MKTSVLVLLFLPYVSIVQAQSRPDESFQFTIHNPLFDDREGPTIGIDEAHNNHHTLTTGLSHLSDLLLQDGFKVVRNTVPFTQESLEKIDILIIVNPLHKSNTTNWKLPNPSAFEKEESRHCMTGSIRAGSFSYLLITCPLEELFRIWRMHLVLNGELF